MSHVPVPDSMDIVASWDTVRPSLDRTDQSVLYSDGLKEGFIAFFLKIWQKNEKLLFNPATSKVAVTLNCLYKKALYCFNLN